MSQSQTFHESVAEQYNREIADLFADSVAEFCRKRNFAAKRPASIFCVAPRPF